MPSASLGTMGMLCNTAAGVSIHRCARRASCPGTSRAHVHTTVGSLSCCGCLLCPAPALLPCPVPSTSSSCAHSYPLPLIPTLTASLILSLTCSYSIYILSPSYPCPAFVSILPHPIPTCTPSPPNCNPYSILILISSLCYPCLHFNPIFSEASIPTQLPSASRLLLQCTGHRPQHLWAAAVPL